MDNSMNPNWTTYEILMVVGAVLSLIALVVWVITNIPKLLAMY